VVCPGQVLGPGGFDVVDRPGRDYAYRPAIGWRVGPDGTAVCVHPYRIGLPPGRYASAGEPVPAVDATPVPQPTPAALELPEGLDDLEGWLIATLRVAAPDRLFAAIGAAERQAVTRFAPDAVTKALRRVLTVELVDR
jgi:hypothetical protein